MINFEKALLDDLAADIEELILEPARTEFRPAEVAEELQDEESRKEIIKALERIESPLAKAFANRIEILFAA